MSVSAKEAVRAGAAWCDENAPKGEQPWFARIDTGLLNINDATLCVLGQLYQDNPEECAGYDYAVTFPMSGLSSKEIRGMGFFPCPDPTVCDCGGAGLADLNEEWRLYIAERKADSRELVSA